MRVAVTRPETDAGPWMAALAAAGYQPLGLPLVAFGPPADAMALQATWHQLSSQSAVMCVSAQAVRAFWAHSGTAAGQLPLALAAGTRFWAPGPGTARALLAQGVPATHIDQPPAEAGQFDSEALWSVVSGQIGPGARVLVVRGETENRVLEPTARPGHGRDWLAGQCEALGGVVGHTVAYRRVVPQWSVEQRAQALSCLEGDAVWLFSSGEGVGQLPRLLPEVCWAGARGLATHSRIADAARALGMGNVRVSRPALPDVLQALSQWRDSSGHSGVLEGHPA